MSANQELKKEVVQEIKDKIKDSKSIILVKYKGLTVEQDTEFRNNFRSNQVNYKVYKNRLLKIAFEELGIKFPESTYDGPTAVAFSKDSIAPARIAVKGVEKYNIIEAKHGWIEGKVVGESEIKAYAVIPNKEVLVGQLLGILLNPIRSLACVLDQAAKK
jgi:large subunit ribosomal protein L10